MVKYFLKIEEEWDHISEEAKELIASMLKYNPKLRLSAAEALMHPWIQNNTHTTPLNQKIFSNLAGFYGDNRFR